MNKATRVDDIVDEAGEQREEEKGGSAAGETVKEAL